MQGNFNLEAFNQQMDEGWICPQCKVVPSADPDDVERVLCYCDTREANLPDHGTHANPCPNARCGSCGWQGKVEFTAEE